MSITILVILVGTDFGRYGRYRVPY